MKHFMVIIIDKHEITYQSYLAQNEIGVKCYTLLQFLLYTAHKRDGTRFWTDLDPLDST